MTTEYALLTIAAFVFYSLPYVSRKMPGMGVFISTLAGLILGFFAYKTEPDFAPWIIYVYIGLFIPGLIYGAMKIFSDVFHEPGGE